MIDFQHFTPISAVIGGTLIGLSGLVLLLCNGKIAGISGIVDKALHYKSNRQPWTLFFLSGLLVSSWLFVTRVNPNLHIDASWYLMGLSGFLVGFGARLGSGCTSGHGVCGIGRFATRSITATLIFVASAMVTVFIVH